MNEYDLSDETASSTYNRLVQIIDGKFYDGLGNPIVIDTNIGLTNTTNIDGGYPNLDTITNRPFKIDFGGVS